MHIDAYLLDGEKVHTKETAQHAGSSSNSEGTLAVTEARVVYTGAGASEEVIDISLDGIVAAEYSKQSPWNQWTQGGLLMLTLGMFTIMMVGSIEALPSNISGLGMFVALGGITMIAYGILFRKRVLKLHTAAETYEFKTKQGLEGMMHRIRAARSQL